MKEIANAEIKRVRSLQEKKFRESFGLFVVEGDKMVDEALGSGLDVVDVYRRQEVGEKAMERMSGLASAPPSLAVVRIPSRDIPDISSGLFLGLDAVRDPGNFGTILRISDWFGADAVFASPDCVDLYNPKVIQASMGAIFRKTVVYTPLPSLCASFRAAGRKVFGTFLGGEDIYRTALPKDGLVVMGNEAHGISGETASQVDVRLTIPSFAVGRGAESLNVAVATAVVLSEFRRR